MKHLAHDCATVTLAQSYDPFGNLFEASGTGVSGFGYTGEQEDGSTGLLFLRARYYDPYLNRFISPDTMIPDFYNPKSLNLYLYVLGNPVNLVDPSGLQGCTPGKDCPVDILIDWFEGPTPPFIDGPGRTPAEQRFNGLVKHTTILHFPATRLTFNPDTLPFGDCGFRREFQDSHYGWSKQYQDSPQVGHFLAAAALGYDYFGPDRIWLSQRFTVGSIVGHELIADGPDYAGPRMIGTLIVQAVWGTVNYDDIVLFLAAAEADQRGDDFSRDELLEQIDYGSGKGNSIEDLRLSVKGWNFGTAIRTGEIEETEEAGRWLRYHLTNLPYRIILPDNYDPSTW